MQYFYGTLHEYIKEDKKYNCYIGKQRVNVVHEDWINIWKELTKKESIDR